jgi:hypothetical protein
MKSILALATALAVTAVQPAFAADPLRMELSYAIYGGGAHILTLDSSTAIDGPRYEMKTAVRSQGLLGWATRFQLDTLSQGLFAGTAPEPALYRSASDGRWGRRSSMMNWPEPGRPHVTRLEPKHEELERFPIPDSELQGVVDPPAAGMMRALASVTGQPCAGATRIFDGRRRYNLHFNAAETEDLPPTRYGAFAGSAIKCLVRYEPIGGGYKKYANDAEQAAQNPIRLWLARDIDPRVWLPVRLEVDSEWANIVVHLVKASVDGATRLAMAEK